MMRKVGLLVTLPNSADDDVDYDNFDNYDHFDNHDEYDNVDDADRVTHLSRDDTSLALPLVDNPSAGA